MQRFSLSWILDRTCVKLCTTVMKQIFCTSLSLCGRQGIYGRLSLGHDPTFLFLHQSASIVLGVCEGYDRVEEISEGGIVCTTSSCLPFCFFLLFLPSLVLLLLSLFELSYAPPLGLQHSFIQCPSPPQFLQVLRSVLLVLLVRVPVWFWCLLLPFSLFFFRESRLAASSAPVPVPADTVGNAPKFREEKHHCNKAVPRAVTVCKNTYLRTVPKTNRCHIHYHCVLDCIRWSCS